MAFFLVLFSRWGGLLGISLGYIFAIWCVGLFGPFEYFCEANILNIFYLIDVAIYRHLPGAGQGRRFLFLLSFLTSFHLILYTVCSQLYKDVCI